MSLARDRVGSPVVHTSASNVIRLALTAVLALLLAACGRAAGNPGVAAVVNGEEIGLEAVEALLQQAQESPAYLTQLEQGVDAAQLEADATLALTSQVIISQLLEQGAAELGIDAVTDADVREALEEIIETQLGGQDAYEALLQAQGLTEAEVLEQVRQIELQDRIGQTLADMVEVTDAEIQAAFDSQYALPGVSHILVSTEDEARAVLDRLAAGETFEDLAVELSEDPGSAANGGSLGTFQPGVYVPEFEQGFLELETGEISEPVETQFGFHIIRADAPPPLDDALNEQIAADLQNQGVQQAIQEFQNRIIFDADVIVNPRLGNWDPAQAGVVASDVLGGLRPAGAGAVDESQ